MADERFSCGQCGADLVFEPGVASLTCPYCGHVEQVDQPQGEVKELDFHAALATAAEGVEMLERQDTRCQGCGAEVTLGDNIESDLCPYCGTQIVGTSETHRVIRPQSLLPFKIPRQTAKKLFHTWLSSRWFAPNTLRQQAGREDALQGVYVPYWTYDCKTETTYRGERGEDYWTTQTYTTTENGKTVTKTRQVRKTRWRPASGTVFNAFDDVLVLASKSLPYRMAEELEPWDLSELAPYDHSFLQGYKTENYQVSLDQGFGIAANRMRPEILSTIRRDIGGDHQRIHHSDTDYDKITFKHVLLPLWISSYRHAEKVYRFLVNARTGEVQGERPYSWVKIALAVLGAALLLGGIAAVFAAH